MGDTLGNAVNAFLTPKRVIVLTLALMALYVLWRGPQHFYYESMGTLVLSPVIYVRLLPPPLNHWLLTSLTHVPLLDGVLCGVPIMLLTAALAAGIYALARNSLAFAFVALGLTAMVFTTYHYLQPLGITLIPS